GIVDRTDKDCPHCQRRLTGRALLENPPNVVRAALARQAEIAAATGTKRCPFCAEEIQAAAIVCRFCQRSLTQSAAAAPSQTPQPWNPGAAAVLSLIIPGAGQMYKGQLGKGLALLVTTAVGYVLLIVPGLVVHLFTVVDAFSGSVSGPQPLGGV